MSIEGSSPKLSFNREETVQESQIVYGSEHDVQIALSHSPRTETPVPIYGRMGFPLPTRAWGDGLEVGPPARFILLVARANLATFCSR